MENHRKIMENPLDTKVSTIKYHQVSIWEFAKVVVPQVTMAFNTKSWYVMVIHFPWIVRGMPVLGHPHLAVNLSCLHSGSQVLDVPPTGLAQCTGTGQHQATNGQTTLYPIVSLIPMAPRKN